MSNLSVIIPAYNAEKYLKRCLDSVLKQTGIDLEVIVIDDGSTDNTSKIAKCYSEKDKRVKLIRTENLGASHARNLGISNSSSKYITFVDSDDYVESETYKSALTILEKHDEVEILIFDYVRHLSNDDIFVVSAGLPTGAINNLDIRRKILDKFYNGGVQGIPSLCNKIYKSDFIVSLNLKIDTSRVRAEDYWFNFYAFKQAQKIYYLDRAYYHYMNDNNGSLMKTFRDIDFELYISTRDELALNNNELKIEIRNDYLYRTLFYDINSFILLMIKSSRPKQDVISKLSNKRIIKYLNMIDKPNLHFRLLRWLYNREMYNILYHLYSLWFVMRKNKV